MWSVDSGTQHFRHSSPRSQDSVGPSRRPSNIGCTSAFIVGLLIAVGICAIFPFLALDKVFETLFVILAVAVGIEALYRRSKGL